MSMPTSPGGYIQAYLFNDELLLLKGIPQTFLHYLELLISLIEINLEIGFILNTFGTNWIRTIKF